MALIKEGDIPQARYDEIVLDVKIRRAALGAVIDRKCLIRNKSRALIREGIYALAPAVNGVDLKAVRKTTQKPGIHRVKIGIYIGRRKIGCEEMRVRLVMGEVLIYE